VGEVGEAASASGILQEGTRERYPCGVADGDGVIANHSDDSVRQKMFLKISL
jgi:hypothetical protein